MTGRRIRMALATAAAVVAVVSALMPTSAWAVYSNRPTAETNVFATHVMLAPTSLSCSGLGVLSVTLSWAAASDASLVTGYDLGQSSTTGGPYTYASTGTGTGTTLTMSISAGNHFYVITALHDQWVSSTHSPEQEVTGILIAIAVCP